MQCILIVVLAVLATVIAECPNGCSGHGSCGTYDQCSCFKGFQSADCSEQICQFAKSWADIPKGDLNANNDVSGPGCDGSWGSSCDYQVVENSDMYGKLGTTEQFPQFKNGLGYIIPESGHELAECASKGICDRGTGTCECFEGYEGSACQFSSCPSVDGAVCSGHGVCKSALQVSNGFYQLWDKEAQMGCECDSGYEGFDCSERKCKKGSDPLSFEGARFGQRDNHTFIIYTPSRDTNDNKYDDLDVVGTYKIALTDDNQKYWETDDIPIHSTCDTITQKIRAIPSPSFSKIEIRCWRSQDTRGYIKENTNTWPTSVTTRAGQATTGIRDENAGSFIHPGTTEILDTNRWDSEKFILSFGRQSTQMPPKIIKHDNDQRPTLYANYPDVKVYAKVYANGHTSYDVDIFPVACKDVYIQFDKSQNTTNGYVVLKFGTFVNGVFTEDDVTHKKFKKCLGDADGDWENNYRRSNFEKNDDIVNFDDGTIINPHVFMLYEATQYFCTNYNPYPYALYDRDLTGCEEPDVFHVPQTLVCPDTWNADDIANNGYFVEKKCANRNPSGIMTVALYSNKTDSDLHSGEFRVYNWIAKGYDSDTTFIPFTSDGIFQNVDKRAVAVGQIGNDVGSQYTSVFHTMAELDYVKEFDGDISCEGLNSNVDLDITSTGSAARQCLVNGDKIFFYAFPHWSFDNDVNRDFNNGDNSITPAMSKRIVDCNAALTNLLTVKNVAKFPNSDIGVDGRPAVLQNNMTQFFIETVEATNARMQMGNASYLNYNAAGQLYGNTDQTLPDCAMYIYKYIANKTATPSGGYEVTQPCSGRGLCDSTTGTCNCFSGYSNDNCDKINNFAV